MQLSGDAPASLQTCLLDQTEQKGAFLLSRNRERRPDRWNEEHINGWNLFWRKGLRVRAIRDPEGKQLGWLLGHIIDTSQTALVEDLEIERPFHQSLREHRESFGGRFLILLAESDQLTTFSDMSGLLCAFRCEDTQEIASRPSLLARPIEKDTALLKSIREAQIGLGVFFPAWLTIFEGVKMLPPNASYTLPGGDWERLTGNDVSPTTLSQQELSAAGKTIAKLLRSQAEVIRKLGPIRMGLTGGHDSRTLFAAFKIDQESNHDWYFHIPLEGMHIDADLAHAIGETFNSTVHSAPGNDPDLIEIKGFGELSYSVYWTIPRHWPEQFTPIRLCERLHLSTHPKIQESLRDWLAHTPQADRGRLLDFLFLDHRSATSQAPSIYETESCAREVFAPLCHPKMIPIILRLPKRVKRQKSLSTSILRELNPLLLWFPFNSSLHQGVKKYLISLKFMINKPFSSDQRNDSLREFLIIDRPFAALRGDLQVALKFGIKLFRLFFKPSKATRVVRGIMGKGY